MKTSFPCSWSFRFSLLGCVCGGNWATLDCAQDLIPDCSDITIGLAGDPVQCQGRALFLHCRSSPSFLDLFVPEIEPWASHLRLYSAMEPSQDVPCLPSLVFSLVLLFTDFQLHWSFPVSVSLWILASFNNYHSFVCELSFLLPLLPCAHPPFMVWAVPDSAILTLCWGVGGRVMPGGAQGDPCAAMDQILGLLHVKHVLCPLSHLSVLWHFSSSSIHVVTEYTWLIYGYYWLFEIVRITL